MFVFHVNYTGAIYGPPTSKTFWEQLLPRAGWKQSQDDHEIWLAGTGERAQSGRIVELRADLPIVQPE